MPILEHMPYIGLSAIIIQRITLTAPVYRFW